MWTVRHWDITDVKTRRENSKVPEVKFATSSGTKPRKQCPRIEAGPSLWKAGVPPPEQRPYLSKCAWFESCEDGLQWVCRVLLGIGFGGVTAGPPNASLVGVYLTEEVDWFIGGGGVEYRHRSPGCITGPLCLKQIQMWKTLWFASKQCTKLWRDVKFMCPDFKSVRTRLKSPFLLPYNSLIA